MAHFKTPKRCIGLFPVYDSPAVVMEKPKSVMGEFWGGLAAMLVALPSAIPIGLTIFSPLARACGTALDPVRCLRKS